MIYRSLPKFLETNGETAKTETNRKPLIQLRDICIINIRYRVTQFSWQLSVESNVHMSNNGTNFNANTGNGVLQNKLRFLLSMLFPINIIINALPADTITLQAWKSR
jgi:hypothetical protein